MTARDWTTPPAPATRHAELYREIDAMLVADCLVWDIPSDLGAHALCASISRYAGRTHPGRVIRTVVHHRRAFVLRLE